MRPDAACVTAADLKAALQDAANPREGRVVVARSGDGVMVRAVWPDGQSLERRVPVDVSECAAVRRVALALVRTWLASPPAPRPVVTPPIPVLKRPTRATAEVEERAVEPALVAPPVVEAVPEPVAPEEAPPVLREAVAGAQPAPPPPDWRVGVGVLAGVTAGTTPEGVFAGTAYVEAMRKQTLGVGLDGGLEMSRATGGAWASARWATLYGKLRLGLTDHLAFIATLGARLWVTEVGAPSLRAQQLVAGGAALTAGVDLDVGPVTLLVRGLGSGRFPEDRVSIAGTKVLFLKWWQVGAMLGLGWHFP